MMVGGWEVLDTAVKIGLGVIVTGGVTIWATRIQLKAQNGRELRQHRQQEWARIMELVIGYRKSLYLFNEAAGDYLVNRDEAQLESDLDRQLGEAKSRLEASLLELVEAHTRLGILEPAAAAALEAYRQVGDEFFRDVWNAKDRLGDGDLAERWERLEDPRESLSESLRRLEIRLNT
jgi:hypothetical protein